MKKNSALMDLEGNIETIRAHLEKLPNSLNLLKTLILKDEHRKIKTIYYDLKGRDILPERVKTKLDSYSNKKGKNNPQEKKQELLESIETYLGILKKYV